MASDGHIFTQVAGLAIAQRPSRKPFCRPVPCETQEREPNRNQVRKVLFPMGFYPSSLGIFQDHPLEITSHLQVVM